MIGVDISGRSVKAVEVVGRGEAGLRTSCWSPLAPEAIRRGIIQDAAQVAAVLRRTLTACTPVSPKGNEVVASIPEVQSFVRVLEMPYMRGEEMDEAVQWAVRRHIPFDLDRVYVDWELLTGPQAGGTCRVLVGAAQRAVVDPLLAAIDQSGLRVVALELEAQAVVRCLLPRDPAEARAVRGVLVVDLGATSTNVVFFDQGAMRYTASIQSGGDDLTQHLMDQLGLSAEQALDVKARVGVREGAGEAAAVTVLRKGVNVLGQKVERIAREMSVQLAREQQVRAVLVSGGGAGLPGAVEAFASLFPGVPVQLGNPLVNVGGGSSGQRVRLPAGDALHFTTAIGLALRGADYLSL